MNAIEASRTVLKNALVDAGLTVYDDVTARFVAPAAMIEAGTPWLSRYSVGANHKVVSWRVLIVAAKQDTTGLIADLAQGALIAMAVIDKLDGYSASDVTGIQPLLGTDGAYLAVVLDTTTHIDITEGI